MYFGLHGPPGPLVLLVFQEKGPYLRGSRARSSAVEHLTFNQVVVGSIPTGLTIRIKVLGQKSLLVGTAGKHGVSKWQRRGRPIRFHKVSVTDAHGKEFVGEYYTQRSMVYVRYGGRQKATQIGGSPASSIARLLLGELVAGK